MVNQFTTVCSWFTSYTVPWYTLIKQSGNVIRQAPPVQDLPRPTRLCLWRRVSRAEVPVDNLRQARDRGQRAERGVCGFEEVHLRASVRGMGDGAGHASIQGRLIVSFPAERQHLIGIL